MASSSSSKSPGAAHDLQWDEEGGLRHLLTLEGMPQETILAILRLAQSFLPVVSRPVKKVPVLRGVSVFTVFFEASTRTRTTFEIAAKRLSADVIDIYPGHSAQVKGESLLDLCANLAAMGADILVVRHGVSGAAHFIAKNLPSRVRVVNAGDGRHAHPTQALLDLFTVWHLKKNFEDLTVAIVGDVLHSRVARSEIHAFLAAGVKRVRIVAPKTLLPAAAEHLGAEVCHDLRAGLEGADVVMALRLQKERMQEALLPSEDEYYRTYGITKEALAWARKDAIVMHPGPINRGVEIDPRVADGPQSVILEQVRLGIAVRMAALNYLVQKR